MIGQTIGHYRIVEKLGAGGMGEVYRAHDEKLDRDVALKILHAGSVEDDLARKRFRTEALALAKLNHPNIATVFEFDTQDGLDFLVMELIPGSSLKDKLSEGPLTEKETIRLGMQLAEGLAAAHTQGVVHRDLKPGNLMIRPEGRLKILDFGLAKLMRPTADPDVTRSITETRTASGTLPYMSPEQLIGEPVDLRGDIYAAGAVLFEMATGQRTFPEAHPTRLVDSILHREPPSPAAINPGVSPGLDFVILKSLEKAPGRRYQSAGELHVALEGLSSGAAPVIRRERPRRSRLLAGSAALALLVLIGVALGFIVRGLRDRLLTRTRAENSGTSSSSAKVRRSVAVLGFKDLSARRESSWLSTALAESLNTELAGGEMLGTIPGEAIARMKHELSLSDSDSFAKDTLARIRLNLGADYVVVGSYLAPGKQGEGQISVNLQLQDAAKGETVSSLAETGTTSNLHALVTRLGFLLREKLGAGQLAGADLTGVESSLPSNPEAARCYSEGLSKLRVFDALGARDLLERAVAIEPEHALSHSALAVVWADLGYDTKAKEEGRKAFESSAKLNREQRLLVEGGYRETSSDWAKAVQCYQQLFYLFPDNVDYGLRLAIANAKAGKGKEALATIKALRDLPAPANDDPRIDLAESSVASLLSDLRLQQEAASRAIAKGKARGTRLLVANALNSEGLAFKSLGPPAKAREDFEEAKQIYSSVGDRHGVADAVNNIAILFKEQGDLAAAKQRYEAALAEYRETGDQANIAMALNNIALILAAQGDLAGARAMYGKALGSYRSIGDKANEASVLDNTANVIKQQGDLPAARKMYLEALALRREVGNTQGVDTTLGNLSDLSYSLGELAEAESQAEEARSISDQIGDRVGVAYAWLTLGGVKEARGNFAAAMEDYDQALKIFQESNQDPMVATTQVSIARRQLEEGKIAEAVSLSRKAVEAFQKEGDSDSEATAQAVLAQCLLAGGDTGQAQLAISAADTLGAKSADAEVRLQVNIAKARMATSPAKYAEAARTLTASVATARKMGLVPLEFEARLALGEIELKSGHRKPGLQHLAELERESKGKGFLRISRLADEAANGQPTQAQEPHR